MSQLSRVFLDQCDSTNLVLKDLIVKKGSDLQNGSWVLTRVQTAGRGRLGRTWVSEPGNFFGSFYAKDFLKDKVLEIPLRVAVAVHKVIKALSPKYIYKIKWPNDIYDQSDAKISGILCESQDSGVIIGIGINLVSAPVLDGKKAAIPVWDQNKDVLQIAQELWSQIQLALEVDFKTIKNYIEAVSYFEPGQTLSWLQAKDLQMGRYLGLGPSGELMVQDSEKKIIYLIGEEVSLFCESK